MFRKPTLADVDQTVRTDARDGAKPFGDHREPVPPSTAQSRYFVQPEPESAEKELSRRHNWSGE